MNTALKAMLHGEPMKDSRDIEEKFDSIFRLNSLDDWIQINDQTGEIKVFGSIEGNDSAFSISTTKLPFAFSEVTGRMVVKNFRSLTTLEGFPRKVGKAFHVYGTGITSLEGGPDHVGKGYWADDNKLENLQGLGKHLSNDGVSVTGNPLKSLEGIYEGLSSIVLDYDPNLPLLRLLLTRNSYLGNMPYNPKEPGMQVDNILKKWRGHGAAGILQCASELNEAGFEGNAEW